jgi:hypothetical protein
VTVGSRQSSGKTDRRSFAPSGADLDPTSYPRLAPWALFLRRFAVGPSFARLDGRGRRSPHYLFPVPRCLTAVVVWVGRVQLGFGLTSAATALFLYA